MTNAVNIKVCTVYWWEIYKTFWKFPKRLDNISTNFTTDNPTDVPLNSFCKKSDRI